MLVHRKNGALVLQIPPWNPEFSGKCCSIHYPFTSPGCYFSVYIALADYRMGYDLGQYALPALVSIVAPIQGFANFLVYIHPCLSGSWSCQLPIALISSIFSWLLGTMKQTTPATFVAEETPSSEQVFVDPSVAIASNHLTAQS